MKKNLLLISINFVVVLLIALVVGIVLKDRFSFSTFTISYVMLLLTLCLPSLFILTDKYLGLGGNVLLALLFAAGLVINILGICKYSSWEFNPLIITHASIVGGTLLLLMGVVAFKGKIKE